MPNIVGLTGQEPDEKKPVTGGAAGQLGAYGNTIGGGAGGPTAPVINNGAQAQMYQAMLARQKYYDNLRQQWEKARALFEKNRSSAMAQRNKAMSDKTGAMRNKASMSNTTSKGSSALGFPPGVTLPTNDSGIPGMPPPDLPGPDLPGEEGPPPPAYKVPLWAQIGKYGKQGVGLKPPNPLGFSSGLGTETPLGLREYDYMIGQPDQTHNPFQDINESPYGLNDPKAVMPQNPWDPRFPSLTPGADINEYYKPAGAFRDVDGNWIDSVTGQALDPTTWKTMTNDVRGDALNNFWDWRNQQPTEEDLAQQYLDWLNDQINKLNQMPPPVYDYGDYGGYGDFPVFDYGGSEWESPNTNYNNFFKALYWRVGE